MLQTIYVWWHKGLYFGLQNIFLLNQNINWIFKKLEDKNICLASNTRRHSCKKNKKNKLWCKGFVAYVFVTAKNLGKGIKNLLCYQPSPYVLKIFGVNKAIVIDVLCICSLPRLFLKISRYGIRKKCLKKATSIGQPCYTLQLWFLASPKPSTIYKPKLNHKV